MKRLKEIDYRIIEALQDAKEQGLNFSDILEKVEIDTKELHKRLRQYAKNWRHINLLYIAFTIILGFILMLVFKNESPYSAVKSFIFYSFIFLFFIMNFFYSAYFNLKYKISFSYFGKPRLLFEGKSAYYEGIILLILGLVFSGFFIYLIFKTFIF